MRKTLLSTAILLLSCITVMAQKQVYMPDEWKNNTSLYRDSDPEGKATWSKTRSVENDDLIIFWDNGYGDKKPSELSKSDFYYVDISDLMAKCQSFYDLEYQQLGFVNPETTNLNKYKMMVLLSHTETWTCYGGGYDFEVNALWINPATCKPVGFSVAHEVGHSFHYMCYSDASGNSHVSSTTVGTGFHLPVGSGQTIWEQTAQWQAAQSYPADMFKESIGVFRRSHNYAFTHEWHRYQSYWFLYYLCQKYGDIKTVAGVWNQPMKGAVDFNQSLMKNKDLSVSDLYALYFDYACRCVTWDLDACRPYRDRYVGDLEYRCVLTGDGSYQVALASCPQSTGFNAIPLDVPEAGTEVKVSLTALEPDTEILPDDPGEYMNGDAVFTKSDKRKYSAGALKSWRGFRMGFVALLNDGTRQYFSDDKVCCTGTGIATDDCAMTVPAGVSRLWLVVSPALSNYVQHKWDENINNDDMWPYRFSVQGTDIGSAAIVYAAPTIDGREAANITLTYDVTFPQTTGSDHSGTTVNVSGKAAAMLFTALQMQNGDLAGKMQNWVSSGPSVGRVMFYALTTAGTLASSGSTANGYGHWFNKAGGVCAYASGYVYSEFSPSGLSFALGQYPGRCPEGSTYTIRQALRYRVADSKYAIASFVFNITVGPAASVKLTGIDYADPRETAIGGLQHRDKAAASAVYDLQGRCVSHPSHPGHSGSAAARRSGPVLIVDGKKRIY